MQLVPEPPRQHLAGRIVEAIDVVQVVVVQPIEHWPHRAAEVAEVADPPGVVIDGAATNTIGGTTASATNLIAGNVIPTGAVTVSIDGQNAAVQGAAAPIGSVPGVLQINATVPTSAKAGNAVPVVVSIGSAKSQNRVTMAVK